MSTTISSPVAWRRLNAIRARQWREGSDLKLKHVASALDCTVAKAGYLETLERPISKADMTLLLDFYKIPKQEWEFYLNAVEAARKKGWWDNLPAGTIPPDFSLFVGLEAGASEIRAFEASIVPGLLQIREYARALISAATAELTTDEIERRTDVRIGRQSVLDTNLRLWLIIDEAALWRVVGSPAIHLAQLERLLEVIQQYAKVTVQVLPFSAGAHPGVMGSFTILDFPWADDPGCVYREGHGDSELLEDKPQSKGKTTKNDDEEAGPAATKPGPVAVHRISWEHLIAKALDPDETESKVHQVIEELKRR